MKRPSVKQHSARARGLQKHRCSVCGETGHRIEKCTHSAAEKIRELKQEVRKLRRGKKARDVKRVEHKTRKKPQQSGSFRKAATVKYSGRPAVRVASPAEIRRTSTLKAEVFALPETEQEAADWLRQYKIVKSPGTCEACSSRRWSGMVFNGHDSPHYRCLQCGKRRSLKTIFCNNVFTRKSKNNLNRSFMSLGNMLQKTQHQKEVDQSFSIPPRLDIVANKHLQWLANHFDWSHVFDSVLHHARHVSVSAGTRFCDSDVWAKASRTLPPCIIGCRSFCLQRVVCTAMLRRLHRSWRHIFNKVLDLWQQWFLRRPDLHVEKEIRQAPWKTPQKLASTCYVTGSSETWWFVSLPRISHTGGHTQWWTASYWKS